jgi:chromosome segregation ATPase
MTTTLALASILGSAGIGGALVALLKLRPERDSIIVNAAQGAVTIQTSLLHELREELAATSGRLDALDTETSKLRREGHSLRRDIGILEVENGRLKVENGELKVEVAELRGRLDQHDVTNGH